MSGLTTAHAWVRMHESSCTCALVNANENACKGACTRECVRESACTSVCAACASMQECPYTSG